jgi:ATP-binding cassette, subfamily B, multidrug efflux pump
MLRLAKYLKPFILLILISIVLLFIQAMSDLSLPDYLSKIINVGIQQGGIENAVAHGIRQSEMDRLTLFMSDGDKAAVLANYTLVDKNSADYSKYVADYPELANQPVYILANQDQAIIDKLNPVMAKAWLAVSVIEQALDDPSKAAAMGQASGFDLSKIPPGTDVFGMMAQMPTQMRASLLSQMQTRFAALGDSMINQSAIRAVKAEYQALGLDTAKFETNAIIRFGLIMLLISLLSGVCTIAVGYFSAKAAAGMARNLRQYVFEKVESFSNIEFDKFSTASLINRSTNDISQIQITVMMLIRMACYAPLVGVGGIIMAINHSPSMSWVIILAVVVLLLFIITIFSISLPKYGLIQKMLDKLNLVAREDLSGMMVIRAFNTQQFEENRFDKANQELTDTNLFVNRVMATMMPVMMFIMSGISLLIVWVGAHRVAESTMQVGDMIAFMQYAMQVVFAFLFLSFMFVILPRAWVSGNRIADVLETELSIHDPKSPKQFPTPFKGTVEFRDVSFRYPGAEADVLEHISFAAQPGQTTAFIGSTGSGKSTLINLIPRFYDVTDGAILIDGVDIREVSQHDLREQIGYIPQKANLFSGTVESNLRYADENASEATLKMATDIAQATSFIAEKPEGLATPISQGGTNVSGGQRQRLSIARALVKEPPIYIFDDSFSALDFKTDVTLRRALKEHTSDSTLLIVAQRINTIKNAEQIVVLDDGKVVGIGTHSQLMETCETYREIALSQLSIEELA